MVLMIFVMSIVPMALAEDDNENEDVEDLNETEDANDSEDETNDSEDSVDEADEDSAEDVNEEVEDEDEVKTDKNGKPLKVVKKIKKEVKKGEDKLEEYRIKMERARKNFEQAQENYLAAKEKLLSNKEGLADIKKDIKACKDERTCDELKKDLRKGVRQHLIKTNELIARSLEKLTSKVEESEVLTEEEKTEALAKINELEAELTAKKEAVEALAEEEVTNEELKTAIKELKDTWQKIRKEQKMIVAGLMNSRLKNVIGVKLPDYAEAMSSRIAEIQELGGDTAAMEEKQAEYQAEMETLQIAQETAEDKWVAFKTGEATVEEWRAAHDEVRAGMKEVKETIREFMKEYKDARKELGVSAEEETTTTEEITREATAE